jgi:hypothetical protein
VSNVCQVQLHHGGRAHAPGRRSFAPARDCSRWFLQRVCGGAGDRDDGFAQQVQGRAYQERTKTELALNAAASAQDELAALRLENQALRRERSEMRLAAAEREARLGLGPGLPREESTRAFIIPYTFLPLQLLCK